MIGPKTRTDWLGLVCDGTKVTALAARGTGPEITLVALRRIDFDAKALGEHGRIPELMQFVAESQLRHCDVHVTFSGSGAVAQKLTMPPLSRRNRERAVHTRLTNYADGRELAIDMRLDRKPSQRGGVQLLAAGVDCRLVRGIHAACRRAGLRVRTMSALASTFAPTSDSGTLVQLVLGERTTTLQLFIDGRLITCRDVLVGRRDFALAYQRPILTENGPLTFTPEQAETLSRSVGIPVSREDEVAPGVLATQLWPTLNPVLQKLLLEVQQSLSHSRLQAPQQAGLSVLALPPLPGLDEFLATELQLQGPLVCPDDPEAYYLAALRGGSQGDRPLDLRPPERRLGDRLTRPALAAGFCALSIILCNSVAPREARARATELQPLARQLQIQLEDAQDDRARVERLSDEAAAQLQRDGELMHVVPQDAPAVGPLKIAFGSLPLGFELLDVTLHARELPARVDLRAAYQGHTAASIVAASWSRTLCDTPLFADAQVTAVSGSGRQQPAIVEIQATLLGGG